MANDPRTMSLIDARELAVRAHGDQCDRDGSFHIAHVARVAEAVGQSDPLQRVAWLHDVLEDTEVGVDDLRARLPAAELAAVLLLTHAGHEPYDDYIDRLVQADGDAGRLARAVKEADMLDNLHRCARDRDPAVGQYGQGADEALERRRGRVGVDGVGGLRAGLAGAAYSEGGLCVRTEFMSVLWGI